MLAPDADPLQSPLWNLALVLALPPLFLVLVLALPLSPLLVLGELLGKALRQLRSN